MNGNAKFEESLFAPPTEEEAAIQAEQTPTTKFPHYEELKKKAIRLEARGGEVLRGTPGDIIQAVKSFMPETGTVDTEQLGPITKKLYGAYQGMKEAFNVFPTSEEYKARSYEDRPETIPENEDEELEDEYFSDFVALANPFFGKANLARASLVALVGVTGKEIAKSLGASEKVQSYIKMGSTLLASLFGKGRGVKSHINNLYDEMRAVIPEGEKIAYDLTKLQKLKSVVKRGSESDPLKQKTLTLISELENKAKDGTMTVADAIDFDKTIGRARNGVKSTEKHYLGQLDEIHSSNLNKYGEQNPEWKKLNDEAKMAYAGIAQSENIKNFFKRNASLKNATYLGAAIGAESALVPGSAFIKIGMLSSIGAAYFAKEMMKRISSNSALRKYYANILVAAANDNKASFARNMAGFERVAEKEFKENPFSEEAMKFLEEHQEKSDE